MDSSMLQIAFKMSLALGAVLMTFGGAVLLARKFSAFSSKGPRSKLARAQMEILSHKAIGPGRSLFLVKCRNKIILLGATNASVNAVTEFDAEEELEESSFSDSLHEKLEGDGFGHRIGQKLREISRI